MTEMTDVTQPELGVRIRRARERRRWTQAQLATAADASVRAVGSWERGEAVPRNRIGVLEAVLGVSLAADVPAPDPEEEALRELGEDRGGFLTAAEVAQLVARHRSRRLVRRARAG